METELALQLGLLVLQLLLTAVCGIGAWFLRTLYGEVHELSKRMGEWKERVVRVETRLEDHADEIRLLRQSKHDHANKLHALLAHDQDRNG